MEELSKGTHKIMLKGIAHEVTIDHLIPYSDIDQKAFHVYMDIDIYWNVVSLRLADFIMVDITSTIYKLVDDIDWLEYMISVGV